MYEEQATLFKVLSDPTRIQLLQLLIEGESCGCTLIDKVNVSQPTLSYHLNLLAKHGLADKVKVGTKHNYYVNKAKIESLRSFMKQILESVPTSCEVPK